MTNGELDIFEHFEICLKEGGHKSERVVYPVLDSYPDANDPVLSYNWSNGKEMWFTLGNNNYMLFRDVSGKLTSSACALYSFKVESL